MEIETPRPTQIRLRARWPLEQPTSFLEARTRAVEQALSGVSVPKVVLTLVTMLMPARRRCRTTVLRGGRRLWGLLEHGVRGVCIRSVTRPALVALPGMETLSRLAVFPASPH